MTVTDNTCVMPDYDVTVSATFEADQTQTEADKSMLELLITRADSMTENQGKYAADNCQLLVDALAKAKDVLADENAMNGDIQPVPD